MRLNSRPNHMQNKTAEGAPAFSGLTPIQQLRRSVSACLLWEKNAYESGKAVADIIETYARKVNPEDLAALAIYARHSLNLRHAPLLLLDILTEIGSARKDGLVRNTFAQVISRADESGEWISIYWRNGRKPIAAQAKKGIADAFRKFDAYQLGKYDRDSAIKLRDVLRIVHPKPRDAEQAELWRRVIKDELESADTWEVALSAGANKKETFERLLRTGRLGYLALLRNLRNMEQAKVDHALINAAIQARKGARYVLPFRYVAAAKAAPTFEPAIDEAMIAAFAKELKLPGKTAIVIDVSGSMYGPRVSEKSDMDRALAAAALGAIARELCEEPLIFATAGNDAHRLHQTEQVPARRGMALVDAIYGLRYPLGSGGIFLRQVCNWLREKLGEHGVDRTIVLTDEQDCDVFNTKIATPIGHGYLINVSTNTHGVGYGPWTHIDGFSENVLRFIIEAEAQRMSTQ